MAQQPYYNPAPAYKDPNTAFLIELVGGILGFLGLGYFYVGKTNDGIIRLIGWWVFMALFWCIAVALMAVVVGLLCIPVGIVLQFGVPIWSAYNLKAQMEGKPGFMPLNMSQPGANPPPPASPYSPPPAPSPYSPPPQTNDPYGPPPSDPNQPR